MEILTIESGAVKEGAKVQTLQLSNGVKIPAIIVGESGRGRGLGILPVKLTIANLERWSAGLPVTVFNAKLGETRAGKPKLIETHAKDVDSDRFLGVFYTKIGFRGGNNHTGERKDQDGAKDWLPFPGQILVSGTIAQGMAGRMGSGTQLAAVMPKDKVFRTAYYGRLYGAPNNHYYKYQDGGLLVATWNEREVSDIF